MTGPHDPLADPSPGALAARDAKRLAEQRAQQPSDEGAGLYRLLVETVRDYAIFALDPNGHVLS
jgi:hypothetical protein